MKQHLASLQDIVSHPNRWRNHRGAALSETDCSEVSTTTIIQFSYITRPIPCPK
ncbi:hypothetical protein HanIR_Chr04g0150881 [Helianthus annuus]|nr:hypothetical protein HanIR_Chr04g0150881 [Helianthus annuus]